MKVGLVITVKNEERILRANLIYHLSIGIDKIFVYFDGTNDNGKVKISDLENVECFNSVDPSVYSDFAYLDRFKLQFYENHTARQCLNTYDAKQKCLKLGINWLLSLDADELFLMGIKKQISLAEFFNTHNNFDVIQLRTLEVLGRKMLYKNVMQEETMFKVHSQFKHWNDRIFFKYFDPYNNKMIKHRAWLGHTMGKCAIKVDSKIIPHNVHRYSSYGKEKLNIL